MLIGTDLHGSAFTYDPFVLYEQRVISNPNLFVAGEVGSGKSSLVKTYLYRQALFGRDPVDRRPEGRVRAARRALGEEPIRLAPGGSVRLEPDRARRRLGRPAEPAAERSPRARSSGGSTRRRRRAARGAA